MLGESNQKDNYVANAWRFSFLRFSLRTLFLVITAVCLFLGYELEWLRRRRAFVDEQVPLLIELGATRSREDYLGPIVSDLKAPSLLWMFNENGILVLGFVVNEGVLEKNGYLTISKTHPSVVRAKGLFPEAEDLMPISSTQRSVLGVGRVVYIE